MSEAQPLPRYSDEIRHEAMRRFVDPARVSGKREFTISVKELMKAFPAEFSLERQGQFCSALRTRNFLSQNGLELVAVHGPASKRSTTVSYVYRFRPACDEAAMTTQPMSEAAAREEAHRLVNGLRGLLKEEIADFGGTEAYMRWVRSDEPAQ